MQTPYGPFAQALERLARVIDPVDLRAALGTAGGELTRLLPDLAVKVGELTAPVKADPDTERHRLHTAVVDLLDGVGGQHPILLVIEDAQWADGPTLLLLRYLARAASGPLLLLVTFREDEVDMPQPLARTLVDLRRSDGVVRLRLAGLSGDEVTEFIERAGQGQPGADLPELAHVMSELTGGNPFLVCEFWRALLETKAVEVVGGVMRLARPLASLGTPESVRDVVSERLSRLAPPTGVLLDLAATAGPEFGLDIVRRGTGLGDTELLSALDEAVRSGIIEELPQRGLGLPVHPRAGPARDLRPADRGTQGRAAPASRRFPRSRRTTIRQRTRGPRLPFRRRRAAGRSDAGNRVQPPRGACRDRRARLRPGGGATAHGARVGTRGPGPASRSAHRTSHRNATCGQSARPAGRSARGRGPSPRAG